MYADRKAREHKLTTCANKNSIIVNCMNHSSKYHTTIFKVPYHHLKSTTPRSSKNHTTLLKVPHHFLQSTTHTLQSTTHPLQSTTPSSSKNNTTSSKYHTILLKVPHCGIPTPTECTAKHVKKMQLIRYDIRFYKIL